MLFKVPLNLVISKTRLPEMNYCKVSFFIMLIFLSACSQILTSPKASYVITDELSNQDTTRQLLKQINFTINHRLVYQLDQQKSLVNNTDILPKFTALISRQQH